MVRVRHAVAPIFKWESYMLKYICASTLALVFSSVGAQSEDITIVLSEGDVATISSEIASAGTPEEAARVFAKLATQAIGQSVADTLQQVLGVAGSQSEGNAKVAGWEQFIMDNGVGLEIHWPSPGLSASSNLPITTTQGRTKEGADAAAKDTTVSISISGTF